jgi:dihydrofolate reductase
LKENIVEQIKNLKQQDGPDIQVHGSGNLIQTLLKYDLVDELWLKIFPITLGNGKRLFENGSIPAKFSLLEYQVSPSGVFIGNYKRNGEVKTGSFV